MAETAQNLSFADRRRKPKICVAGAGAIGLTIAATLGMAGHRVNVVARGKSLSAIRDNGIRFVNARGEHKVPVTVALPLELPPQDIIFLAPKAYDLLALAEAIQPLIGRATILVPLVNGIPWWYFDGTEQGRPVRTVISVDPTNRLRSLLPSSHVIGAVVTITADRIAPGFARSLNPLHIDLGEIDDTIRDRTRTLGSILEMAGISTSISNRIRDALWTKVIANLILNPLSVVSGATLQKMFTDRGLRRVCQDLFLEADTTARSFGARVSFDFDGLAALATSMGEFKTSMLQDFEKGAPLELSSICDAVIELASANEIPMPLTSQIARLARFRWVSSLPSLAARRIEGHSGLS